ncbi:nuclear transport factor 2 family protein [Streptomyces apocyni]|uniref:nuclear transport factor 2 family protein n=1 Tax=Streptomyces apocyni TaxID=2654677 RepID=UPI0012EAB3E8|nr:nuclear transport factor 2 family protein [Streptomyces apocyni]
MTSSQTEAVTQANTAFYEAMERGDYDELAALWLDDGSGDPDAWSDVSCVHPGWQVLTGRGEVLRSYAALMAQIEYIQYFLTDLRVRAYGDTAIVTCTENILLGGPTEEGSELGPLVGQQFVATNVFHRTPDGWKMWAHHSSPVLSDSDEEEDGEGGGGGGGGESPA